MNTILILTIIAGTVTVCLDVRHGQFGFNFNTFLDIILILALAAVIAMFFIEVVHL